MIRKLITLFGTVAIVVVGIGVIVLMGSMRPNVRPQAPQITPPTVFFTVATPSSVTLDVQTQGEVRPRTEINLTAQVSGKIAATSAQFVNGGAFNEGDLLLKIEDADYRIALTGAKARVAQAEEMLRREEAESTLAKRDFEELGVGGTPSELTLRLPQLAQARAAYEAAQADSRAAQLNLDRTNIRAPFKGRVRERLAGEGQFVTPGAALGRLFSTDIAEIRLALTDADLAKLGLPVAFVETESQPGPKVTLTAVMAGKSHTWSGRIARADGAIDPTTRQISVIAVVDDPYGEGSDEGTPLAMGLFVNAKIAGMPYSDAIVLPRSALYGRDTVYVIGAEDRLERRRVNIVSAESDAIVLGAGVYPGERVAISPLRGADHGDVVTPMDPAEAGADETAIARTPAAEAVAHGGDL
jgi:RND family efflux transporter MFP subunit